MRVLPQPSQRGWAHERGADFIHMAAPQLRASILPPVGRGSIYTVTLLPAEVAACCPVEEKSNLPRLMSSNPFVFLHTYTHAHAHNHRILPFYHHRQQPTNDVDEQSLGISATLTYAYSITSYN